MSAVEVSVLVTEHGVFEQWHTSSSFILIFWSIHFVYRPHFQAMLAVGMETGLALWNIDASIMQSRYLILALLKSS